MADEAEKFFSRIFPAVSTGFATLWLGKGHPMVHCRIAHGPAKLAEVAAAYSASGRDVYVGLAGRSSDLGLWKRGRKGDLERCQVLWLDVDIKAPGHAADNLPPDLDAALELVEAVGPEVSMIVDSGGGIHAYWVLDQPFDLSTPAQVARFELGLKAILGRATAHGRPRGWHVDNVADATRVLRVPGTFNRKVAPRPVTLIYESPVTHPFSAFEQLVVPLSAGTPPAPSTTAPAVAPRQPRPALTLTEVRQRLTNLRSSPHRAAMKSVLDGKPFAQPGERDSTLQSLASMVAFIAPDNDPAELASLFLPSLDEMAAEPDAPTQSDVEEKISRAQTDAQIKIAQREAVEQAILASVITSARKSGGCDEVPDPGAPYSDEELSEIAGRVGAGSAEGLQRRWIIQRGTAYYVLVGGRYKSPISKEELAVALPKDLSPAPIKWKIMTRQGERLKTVPELLAEHCTIARFGVAHLDLAESWFDERSETFHEAVCPLRVLEPQFNQKVADWLELMPANPLDTGHFHDWLATVTELSKPTAALYLSGPRSAGKGMLAMGLARLWADSPTELRRVLDDWTADIARCPLIFADEHLPDTWHGRRTSAELRALVAATSRTLTRKYIQNFDLTGAVRLFLAANNDRLLNLGDEDVGQEDLAAFGDRFLHIEVGQAAADYLANLGGRSATEDWVSGDVIARHVLWLKQTRKIVPGKRFLVEGPKDGLLTRNLALQGNLPALCAEWIARHLDQPRAFSRSTLVRIGGGKVLVNSGALVEGWKVHIRSGHHVPTTNAIGRALANLAIDEERVGKRRYHSINVELVLAWARRNQVGDSDAMRTKIDGPAPPAPVDDDAIPPAAAPPAAPFAATS